MTTMMDIILSSFIGGFITLIIMNANLMLKQTWAQFNSNYIVQQMLINNAQVVEAEFRNMGCGLYNDQTTNTITEARDTSIEFRMALRPEPNYPISTIKYFVGSVDELSYTQNPNDRFLYRIEDNGSAKPMGVVTCFNIRYFNKGGDTLITPVADNELKDIRLVELTIEMQSPDAQNIYADEQKYYSTTLWKQTRLASQNLNR